MRETVVEGIPEIADTSRFGAWHAEAELVGGEIPVRRMSVECSL
jgi:hypothetical protein